MNGCGSFVDAFLTGISRISVRIPILVRTVRSILPIVLILVVIMVTSVLISILVVEIRIIVIVATIN